ncbi:hypothetical protein C1752_00236 [Acaryochloris thomasi RCC1774]|uniref:Uncharacterized protein n=1 Tax=Acaryochloris thomasi RCC1774 TaxID=1764569 RepID=A0A2W1JQ41_9CYAN|nr:hypothetical protein [Acaryochloris thomasi]PZD75460.1 hypothetical protein C1752_00236 [Acaryochloris thomasi RCC1774]
MSLNSALFLLICLSTVSVLVVAIKLLDRLARPFRQQLQPPDGPQDQPIEHHLNPIDATLLTSDTDCIAVSSDVYEGAARSVEGATEGFATAIEAGMETLSGLFEGITTD